MLLVVLSLTAGEAASGTNMARASQRWRHMLSGRETWQAVACPLPAVQAASERHQEHLAICEAVAEDPGHLRVLLR